MIAYLIECGNYRVIYVKELTRYYLLTPELFELFRSEQPDFSSLGEGHSFPCNDPELLRLFFEPEENAGAVIARRDSTQPKPNIYHRHRFKI